MNDRAITLTREEAQIVEAALQRHLRSLRRGKAGRRILSRETHGLMVLHLEIRDTESALEKVRSA